mgnify:CR=1 FL=1
MAMYWTCRYGANHDPGERCDCGSENRQEKKKNAGIRIPVSVGAKGQLEFAFGKEEIYEKTVV